MKIALTILLVILTVLASGCTTSAPAAPATPVPGPQPLTTPHAVPSLLGNWSGPARGYTEGIGYRDTGSVNIMMSITSQQDRFFTGTISFPLKNGSVETEGFAGVISHDGNTFRIVEYDTHEHDDGWILSGNEIEMIFMADEEPQSIIVNSFRRQP